MVKYGLIIGITYENTSMFLKGVRHDITSINKLLRDWKFEEANIVNITEKSTLKPTSYTITTQLNSFVQRLEPDDVAVIYYSGHGMQNKNRESSIIPIDYKANGSISSETIRYYLNKISSNVNVLCIFDSCSSGTICNLKYHFYDTSYRKDLKQKLSIYDPLNWITRQHNNVGAGGKASSYLETEANIISISGCWDDEVSYDLGKNGALTLSLMSVLSRFLHSKNSDLQLSNLLKYLRGSLIHLRLKQTPQLMCGRSFKTLESLETLSLKSFLQL